MINRYLLGEASAQEQTEIEKRFFTDPDFLDQVVASEDDLIDAYVRGQLTRSESKRFESIFLTSPERLERVQNARALLTHLGELSPPRQVASGPSSWVKSLTAFFHLKPALQMALAAALVVAVAATAWLVVNNLRSRDEANQKQAEVAPPDAQQKQAESQPARPDEPDRQVAEKSQPAVDEPKVEKPADRQQPSVVSFLLVPGLSRDVEQVKRITIPPGAQAARVQLSIEVKGEYKNLRASLRRDGNEIWSKANLKLQQSGRTRSAVLMIPASLLAAGSYTITLAGMDAGGASEVLGDYPFAVVRK